MVTKEILKHEIDILDDRYLELIYKILRQFPHIETASVANPSGKTRDVTDLQALFKETQALPQIQNITEADIDAEIQAYRNGQ
jgi:hypothetical protein